MADLQWGTMTQAEAKARAEFANIEAYFIAKGLPADIARKATWQADWTDEEYEVMARELARELRAARSK
jgi:hypothetical protein